MRIQDKDDDTDDEEKREHESYMTTIFGSESKYFQLISVCKSFYSIIHGPHTPCMAIKEASIFHMRCGIIGYAQHTNIPRNLLSQHLLFCTFLFRSLVDLWIHFDV